MNASVCTALLRGVTRTFKDVTAVDDLDLQLEPGRIYGLLGPNGSGKTTTLKTMLGLIEPDRGVVELFGVPPNDAGRARVGYVPEQRALPTSRVDSLLEFVVRMRGYGRAEATQLAQEWIDRLDLGEKAGDRIKTLSNGQQQKVQIALAMICEPDVLMMDEPLAALDPQHQELVVERIQDAAASGATVIVSTHRLHDAEKIIDHVVMMYRGTKVLDEPLARALQATEALWRVRAHGDVAWIDGPEVMSVDADEEGSLVRLQPEATVGPLLQRASASAAQVRAIEAVTPTLHELYLAKVRAHDPAASLP